MALATIKAIGGSESPVIRGAITMPRTGAWVASLHVDSQTVLSGKVQITAGALTLLGTINRSGLYRGIMRARVVAGGDGLRNMATSKHYTTPSLRLPLSELAVGAGETVSPTSNQDTLGRTLPAWTTIAIETGAMLDALISCAPAGTLWRMLADGSIWVGAETWPDSGLDDFREIEESPEDGSLIIGTDVPRILPGTVVGDRKIDLVEHQISPEEYRAKVWMASP